jgi:MoaA/NifB/PqqE/SkfB family radical SAM enzyme
MTTEQVFSMIDQFYQMGMRKIGISGGEPLIRNDIGRIIRYCKKKGIYISMTTNGTLIEKRIDDLKHVDLVLVSLDGPPEVQKETKKNDSNKLLQDIRLLRKNNVKVWSSTVITKQNLRSVDYLFSMAKKYGFKILFQPVQQDLSWAEDMPKEMIPSDEEIKKTISYAMKKNPNLIANSKAYINFILKRDRKIDHKNCLAGIRSCLVDSNGDIYPCFLSLDRVKPTNGLEMGFKKAFKNGPVYRCHGCTYPCHIEMYYLYSLDHSAIFNVIKSV